MHNYHSNKDYGHWVDRSPLQTTMLMKQEIIDLVEQAKNGSERAFTKLYNLYKPSIWFHIYNVVKNIDVADDLTSIVFTKAYRKLDSYINHISFEMWLKTIAINSAIDYIRRMKNEKLNNYIDEDDNPIQLNDLGLSPEEETILKEKVRITNELIPTLKKQYRDLLEARISGMSYKDMSKKFALNESAVKSLLNKARQKLKQKLSKY